MTRRDALVVAGLVLGLGVVLRVASSEPVEMWNAPTIGIDLRSDDPPVAPTQPTTPPPEEEELEQADDRLPSWIDRVFQLVLMIVVAAIGAAMARSIWRRRGWHRHALVVPRPVPAIPRVRAALSDAADEVIAELRHGTPRNAIVACWVRLERAVDESGLQPRPADTPSELVERVLAEHLVDSVELDVLASLYREARFSTHELDESHRARAIAALLGIREQLGRSRPSEASSPAGAA